MRISATDFFDGDELTWGAEPDLRAVVKMRIAEIIARKLRTNDLIAWEWAPNAGKLEITGSIDVPVWCPINTAPTDGTRLLVSCGDEVWFASQRNGPSVGGQPTTGHLFASGPTLGRRPVMWMPAPLPGRT